eukprot:CAMPEP_0181451902 /NCGR_PEP_ID=MMETSP1110-20121109/28933_1 /TAXON_ID=174948 /ORGANISM="Symbiodinium sp., Strain CCMP421" /LENGTH=48 /DNA_ID= /DNA_START= /DNA_END= /DNA_ORIENTATION=
MAKCQALQGAWQAHASQRLVEALTKSDALQAAWQAYSLQTLIEPKAKG